MTQESSLGARISIWRPFTPEKSLTFHTGQSKNVTVVGPEMAFQQEAFTWNAREDVWGGLIDSEIRTQLSERLIGDFQPTLPPMDRGITKLENFLEAAEAAAVNSEWSNSGQQLERDGETPVRLNSLLAFCVQLRWICQVFKDIPGASVSVR